MSRLDDIRSPQQKIKPRLLRHIFKPTFLSSRLALTSYLRWPLNLFKKHLIIFSVLLAIIGAGWSIFRFITQSPAKPVEQAVNVGIDPRTQAIQQAIIKEDTTLAVDFTFNLQLNINGQPQAIPANYGQLTEGKTIFSSANANGDIHVQSATNDTYTISDFFLLWGGQFNRQCLLNHCTNQDNALTMTVNEQPNNQYGDYIIQPDDRIIITYSDQSPSLFTN